MGNENDSHSFQGIQSHYNTYFDLKSRGFLHYFSEKSVDFSCLISYNNYVNWKINDNNDINTNKQQRGYDVRNNHNDTIWYRIGN